MRRITRQTILDEGFKGVDNLSTPGGHQSAYVLRVDLIPLWLSGIRTSDVKEEIRPKLEHYQREAAKVLWEAFQAGRLTADFTLDELLVRDTPAGLQDSNSDYENGPTTAFPGSPKMNWLTHWYVELTRVWL